MWDSLHQYSEGGVEYWDQPEVKWILQKIISGLNFKIDVYSQVGEVYKDFQIWWIENFLNSVDENI